MAKGYKHTTCKQEGGDDGYCYVVRDKRTNHVIVNGCTRTEAIYYRQKYEQEMEDKKK